jgi:hypothetical protein
MKKGRGRVVCLLLVARVTSGVNELLPVGYINAIVSKCDIFLFLILDPTQRALP